MCSCCSISSHLICDLGDGTSTAFLKGDTFRQSEVPERADLLKRTKGGCQVGAVEDYWAGVAAGASAEFARIRAVHADSSVKGAGNEGIVAEFMQSNTGARRVATNSTIIDRSGGASDEVDVAVLNESQPFWTRRSGELLIAEGVDATYQVKAVLTSGELRRGVRNALSVKQLVRVLPMGSTASAVNDEDGTRFIDHIPFFIFAFTSQITAETALRVLRDSVETDYALQPDGVFVLDGWSLINVGSNAGSLQVGPPEARGLQQVRGDQSALVNMLWCHHIFLRKRVDLVSPIVQYWPFARLSNSQVIAGD